MLSKFLTTIKDALLFLNTPICYYCYVILFLLLLLSCQSENHSAEQPLGVAPVLIEEPPLTLFDLTTLLDENHPLEAKDVTAQFDHTFKQTKQYKAYLFKDVLDYFLAQLEENWVKSADPAKILVTYQCGDGYNATMTLKNALSQDSYLAFTDLSSETAAWTGKLAAKMPPFYLIWENIPYEDKRFVWPFGLSKLKLTPYEVAYQAILPEVNMAGFQLFEQNCLKCHSLNKVGGSMGPEFNYPKNILEYWEEEDIWAFINNPKSYRYSSKMPPIKHLQRSEFDQIMAYLEELGSKETALD